MNQEQVLSLCRAVLTIVGTILMTNGWVKESDWQPIVGALLTIVPVVWAMWAKTTTNQIKSTAALPDVAAVEVKPTTAGVAASRASTPSATIKVNGK